MTAVSAVYFSETLTRRMLASNEKITVKKGLKKGTYKVGINVTAAGDENHEPGTKLVTITIKVK